MLPSCEMVRRAGGCLGFVKCERLKRVLVAFAGADAQRGFDIADENLAVADAAGLCGGGDRLDDAFGHRIFDDDFEPPLGQTVDDIFRAAIELGMTLLPPATLGLGDGAPADTAYVHRSLPFVQLERLDDRLNLLHP